jgi:hypothetical protein
MDKKQFDETLKQLAELDEPEYWETVYDTELDPETGLETVIKRDVLVKGQATLKKLKPCLRACDFCEKTVTDQVVNIRLAQDPVPHWRWHCTSCRCYLHPETKQPLDGIKATSIGQIGRYHKRRLLGLEKWARPQQAEPESKRYKLSTMDTSGRQISVEIDETDNTTITRYVYDRDK